MYKTNRKFNEDKEYFGFKLRTRHGYQDEKIINQCLDESRDTYRIPKNPKVVIDVGSNIGCVSLVATRRGAEVWSFEPSLENYETLVYNVNINGFKDKIHCIQKGVGIPNKKTKLYIHPKNSGATSSYLEQRGLTEDKYQEVEFISIYDVFNDYNIEHCDFLKLDCEGSERDIINDLDDDLANKIDQISVEFHNKPLIEGLINKLSKWYKPEHLRRYEWTFRKI